MKYSAMAHPAYGAMYWRAAGSAAVAATTMVCSIAPRARSASTMPATMDAFWPTATYTQITPVSFWLMMASIARDSLPVPRSPISSSRCPLPMGTMASMALTPVCRGSFTDWRSLMPGALNSTGRVRSAFTSPLSSMGIPSGFTTRPMSSWPTGTWSTRPVRLTLPPSWSLI